MIVDHGKHFARHELECQCGCGRAEMDSAFMAKLDRLRELYGAPLRLTSAFRCPAHNMRVSSTGSTGPHTTGKAADVQCAGTQAHIILDIALELAFAGVGIHQRGPHAARFIHLDTVSGGPRPWVWSYG